MVSPEKNNVKEVTWIWWQTYQRCFDTMLELSVCQHMVLRAQLLGLSILHFIQQTTVALAPLLYLTTYQSPLLSLHALGSLDGESENLHSAVTSTPETEVVVPDIEPYNYRDSPGISAQGISAPDNDRRIRLQEVHHLHQSCLQGTLQDRRSKVP